MLRRAGAIGLALLAGACSAAEQAPNPVSASQDNPSHLLACYTSARNYCEFEYHSVVPSGTPCQCGDGTPGTTF